VPLPGERTLEVGQVVALNKKEGVEFGVNTGDGVLGILRVQLEGKQAMSAAEFLRGQRQFIGAILSSS
jgi:methionyl-tRNA formyltransferase